MRHRYRRRQEVTVLVVAWFLAGAVLLGIELHHWAFFALFGAVGAFAAGGVGLVAPHHASAQVATFLVVTAIGLVAVRPFISRAFDRRRGGHVATGVHGGIVGQHVLTLDDIGDTMHPGHVRLAGERWLAVSGGEPIAPGRPVRITAVAGTTLTVEPVR